MNNEKNKFLTVSWLSGLLSAEIFISTGEWGVQMPHLTAENSHFLLSGPQEATLVMFITFRSEFCHPEVEPQPAEVFIETGSNPAAFPPVTDISPCVKSGDWHDDDRLWLGKMLFDAHDGWVSDVVIAYFLSHSTIGVGRNLSGLAGWGFVMGNFSISILIYCVDAGRQRKLMEAKAEIKPILQGPKIINPFTV